jgi:hypothetical protein
MKAYKGSKGITPPILNLSTTRRREIKLKPQLFNPGEIVPSRERVGENWGLSALLDVLGFELRMVQAVA